jgi:chorismate mutase/prephenate dehydrogenase
MTSSSDSSEQLAKLRENLAALDEAVLGIIAQRQSVAKEIGRLKTALGHSSRDFVQEKQVAERARKTATVLGLDVSLADELALTLIRASLTAQEQDRVAHAAEGNGRRVLIIGGAGKMGRWFARFLSSQGFTIEIADPAGPVEQFAHVADWRALPLDHDIVIVAAPLRASALILEELANKNPKGVVFDVGSLKTPLRGALQKLRDAGVAITSIHPMFGPDTELLSGRHVIFVDLGDRKAMDAARELFAPTMVTQVEMDLDSHDRLIAYVLGLSHALNIAFVAALSNSGEDAEQLTRLSSTTFDAQVKVARRVAKENPHLYFEIQSLNEHGRAPLDRLVAATEQLRAVVAAGDEAAFKAMMEEGARYLDG